MKSFSTKQFLIFFIVVAVLLAAAQYVVYSLIRDAGQSVSTLLQDVSSLQAQVTEFSKYSTADLLRLATAVNARFIPNGDFVSFIQKIETAGRAGNVTVTTRSVDVQPYSDDATGDKEFVHLQFDTKGSWQDTMRFINQIENLPYKITIHSIALSVVLPDSGKAISGTQPTWQAEVELTALKFK